MIHNREASEADRLSIDDIVEGISSLKLASVDTSRSVTESMMNHFVNDEESYEWFKNKLVSKFDE